MSEEKKGFFDGASPKFTFTFGILIGIAIISTVAFFVTLSLNLGGEPAGAEKQAVVPTAAGEVPTPVEEIVTVNVADMDLSNVYVRGDKSAPVTIVEYSDFECPFCSSFHTTMEQIMEDYEGDVKWVWKHYPLSFHPEAEPAANAAECAGEQGKFWEYADGLYTNQTALGETTYNQIAADLGLDTSAFSQCLTANKFADLFTSDLSEGTSIGINGTPGNVIFHEDDSTGEIIAGAYPYETIASKIEALLE